MKRSVAIIGPTPAFVRWAIWHPCDLRPLEERRFVDQCFRTLRGIRAYSAAEAEGRIHDGFCLHPEITMAAAGLNRTVVESPRGFSIDEVTAPFGGTEHVQASCVGCPANLVAEDGYAGCYGFLPCDGSDLERRLAGHTVPNSQDHSADDLPRLIQQIADSTPEIESLLSTNFKTSSLIWHRLWQSGQLAGQRLEVVNHLFQALLAQFPHLPPPVRQFANVLRLSLKRKLAMRVELVPGGNSDGQTWQLNPTCPQCDYEPGSLHPSACPICGRAGALPPGPKFKVLGNRPYGDLERILGKPATEQLVARYLEAWERRSK